jgi:hypothetical protein
VDEEIEVTGHKIKNRYNIRHSVTGKPLSRLFLDREPADNNNLIYYIEYLQNFTKRKNNIQQCRRCQAYFHIKGHCAHRPRCVKCGKSHSTEKFTLRHNQRKCLSCGEPHLASHTRYKVYQETITQILASPRLIASIHFTNLCISREENESPATL